MCRCVRRCVSAINNSLFDSVITFSNNLDVAVKFYDVKRMPSVAGCLDGTHINLEAPNMNESQYVNRHGRHSINAMCVCGPDRRFYYVSARWPGSVNDARVVRNSSLYHRFTERSGTFFSPILFYSGIRGLSFERVAHDNKENPLRTS